MREVVATIGTFDGVHLGHQAVLAELERVATRLNAQTVACVFQIPPRRSMDPKPAPHLLLPFDYRARLLKRTVDRLTCLDFPTVRDLSPLAFARRILVDELGARAVVVGAEFRFAQDRAGSVATLQEIGKDLGFEASGVDRVYIGQQPVSSTRIRRQVADGHVEDAAILLGRPHILIGQVVHGQKIGRRLGFPTANLYIDPSVLLPGDGVYLVHAFWEGHRTHGLLYIGRRPTVGTHERRCEVLILSEDEIDLCGSQMEIHLHTFLREDRAYPSLDELRNQIAADVSDAECRMPKHPLTIDPISG